LCINPLQDLRFLTTICSSASTLFIVFCTASWRYSTDTAKSCSYSTTHKVCCNDGLPVGITDSKQRELSI